MVTRGLRLAALIAFAALLGAVGIGPKRDTGPSRSDDERRPVRPAAPAPAAAPLASGPVSIRRREGPAPAPRRRFSHRFDGRVHWYGYPFGASYYWLRPYGGFWWMWDSGYARWVYWHDGFWWWPGPAGARFVQVGGDYYPYETVRRAWQAPSAAPPAAAPGPWSSPDGRRLVEVSGPESQAVLYDKTTDPPSYIRLLGKGARRVRFTSAEKDAPPTIAVELDGGAWALFDHDGRRLDALKPGAVPAPPPAGEAPPALPAGLPPPPDDLPPP
ncbi:MAG: hypothetical protein HYX59_12725 [Elusimicrobia bacterium]|nr:hypothetical protein [Elusimicrobiota bacterium]